MSAVSELVSEEAEDSWLLSFIEESLEAVLSEGVLAQPVSSSRQAANAARALQNLFISNHPLSIDFPAIYDKFRNSGSLYHILLRRFNEIAENI